MVVSRMSRPLDDYVTLDQVYEHAINPDPSTALGVALSKAEGRQAPRQDP